MAVLQVQEEMQAMQLEEEVDKLDEAKKEGYILGRQDYDHYRITKL